MYKYETHLHTSPVSECALASVEEQLTFYKELGYDGVFITNHFLDGNINIDKGKSYEEKLDFYCALWNCDRAFLVMLLSCITGWANQRSSSN